MGDNPFITGNPVPAKDFINRQRELRRVVGRIRRNGQSSALVGEPRSGKTSLLYYLMDESTRIDLYANADAHLFFRYLDVDTLGSDFSQADFWRFALEPLVSKRANLPKNVQDAVDTCQQNHYTTYTLEALFARMRQEQFRLVLLIDEFDRLLGHATLNNAEFYGGMRSLASRSGGALSLTLASRSDLATLNQKTQEFSRTGSPYFNFLEEIPVRPFGKKAAEALLSKGEEARFTPKERHDILFYAGGHPYYIQVAASTLWETYEDLDENVEEVTPEERWNLAFESFYQQVSPTIENTWALWPPAIRKTITIIALDEIPTLLGKHRFHIEALLQQLEAYSREIKYLTYRGFLKKSSEQPCGWELGAKIMLVWLGDELRRALRQNDQMVSWLIEQGWEGMFTRKEKEELVKAVKALQGFLPLFKSLW